MNRFGITTLALAIGLSAAPRVWAQSTSAIQICRDGTAVRSTNLAACVLHGGIDQQATSQASRGIYSTNGTAGNRGVYNGGTVNGSSRQIYGGGNSSGTVDRTRTGKHDGRWDRRRDHDADHVRWNRQDRDDDRRAVVSREQERERDRERYRAGDNRR